MATTPALRFAISRCSRQCNGRDPPGGGRSNSQVLRKPPRKRSTCRVRQVDVVPLASVCQIFHFQAAQPPVTGEVPREYIERTGRLYIAVARATFEIKRHLTIREMGDKSAVARFDSTIAIGIRGLGVKLLTSAECRHRVFLCYQKMEEWLTPQRL